MKNMFCCFLRTSASYGV